MNRGVQENSYNLYRNQKHKDVSCEDEIYYETGTATVLIAIDTDVCQDYACIRMRYAFMCY